MSATATNARDYNLADPENHTEQTMGHHKRALMGLKMRDHIAARATVEADIGRDLGSQAFKLFERGYVV